MIPEETLQRYARVFEELAPERLEDLAVLVADEVRFVDPFNDLSGREAFLEVFRDMFRRLEQPAFAVSDVALGQQAGYLRWRMTFRSKPGGKLWQIDGLSELRFAEDGRVVAHIDHWDSGAQFYGKLPGLGWLIERVRRRVAH